MYMYPVKPGQGIPDAFIKNIQNMPNKIHQDLQGLQHGLNNVNGIISFINNPLTTLNGAVKFISFNSLPIFTLSAIIATYAYMAGSKKSKTWIGYSVYGYLLFSVIGMWERGQ